MKGDPGCKERALAVVKRTFRPELLNRLQAIVVFNSLSKANLRAIVQKLVGEVQTRLTDRQIVLKIDDAACDLVLEQADDPQSDLMPLPSPGSRGP
eukprot:m.314607 g.314607  ORF g.314607 m.314607 type:complete len:96 (+) comp16411_c0_seq22:521-808(+)